MAKEDKLRPKIGFTEQRGGDLNQNRTAFCAGAKEQLNPKTLGISQCSTCFTG